MPSCNRCPSPPRLPRFPLNNLRRRVPVLRTLPPSIAGAESIQNDYITYTEASFENGNGGIAAVLIDSIRKTPTGVSRADCVVRDTSILPSIRELPDALPIPGAEFSAFAISAPHLRFLSMGATGETLTIYIGNNSFLGGLGGIRRPDRFCASTRFHFLAGLYYVFYSVPVRSISIGV